VSEREFTRQVGKWRGELERRIEYAVATQDWTGIARLLGFRSWAELVAAAFTDGERR
jgi:hypothetical protein